MYKGLNAMIVHVDDLLHVIAGKVNSITTRYCQCVLSHTQLGLVTKYHSAACSSSYQHKTRQPEFFYKLQYIRFIKPVPSLHLLLPDDNEFFSAQPGVSSPFQALSPIPTLAPEFREMLTMAAYYALNEST